MEREENDLFSKLNELKMLKSINNVKPQIINFHYQSLTFACCRLPLRVFKLGTLEKMSFESYLESTCDIDLKEVANFTAKQSFF
jgi:hypothetical protein